MSNRRKLPADRASAERCTACGRRIGGNMDALRLRNGQTICPRCRQYGELPKLACGHYGLPGGFAVRNEGGDGDTRCPRCAPDSAALAGNLRLGMAPRRPL